MTPTPVIPDFDFETYSEAGYYFDDSANRWRSITKSPPHGLGAVGAPAYAEHPSTEILSLAYDLYDGAGARLWVPGCPPPQDLFDYIAAGGPLQAWNVAFEYYMWTHVAHGRIGWPRLPLSQLHCAMARARHFSLPGALDKAGEVLGAVHLKLDDGKRLLNKFSKPRHPTKNDPRRRIRPEEDPEDGPKLYAYNVRDIEAEAEIAERVPPLPESELALWRLDQEINTRGVAIDTDALDACANIIDQARRQYTAELQAITGGTVTSVDETEKMREFLATVGVRIPDMRKETVAAWIDSAEDWVHARALAWTDPDPALRVLEIRQALGARSVGKVDALQRRINQDGRIRDMFRYHAAHTGRWAGAGPQPQNLKSDGPPVKRCDPTNGCGRHYRADAPDTCPWCNAPEWAGAAVGWSIDAAQDALEVIALRDLRTLEHYFGNALDTVAGCLRALFVAAPGHELICSDYVSIEAVCVACLAGEQWRIDAFRNDEPLYLMMASSITGIPVAEYQAYKAKHGKDHPHRKAVGKVAELASPYGGGVGAWRAFGADAYFDNEDAIRDAVRTWRARSPMIAGDWRQGIKGLWYGLEDAAQDAIRTPGQWFTYRLISYYFDGRILFCRLPSGRDLKYHNARLIPDVTPWGDPTTKILYDGWNSDSTKGPVGWITFDTWGGKLTENVTQAVARDILAHGMNNVTAARYPIVLHIHDEIASEVPAGFGSVEHFESLMVDLPPWCRDWPIRAAGGWRGHRYRKD